MVSPDPHTLDLIFARGLSGSDDAQQWKPNVAASANWQYTIRDPKTSTAKIFNWLNPGPGTRPASLNQGGQSVEFGAGFNLALWGGFVKVGYGWNLSAGEISYVYLGIDLLNLLGRAPKF